MIPVRHIFTTLVCTLLTLTATTQALQPGKWMGTFSFASGTEFLMVIEVDQVAKKRFTGKVYWPDYFNNAAAIEGSIKKKNFTFKEVKLLQGKEMDMSSKYQFVIGEEGELLGTAGQGSAPNATFKLKNYDQMTPSLQAEWDERLAAEAQKWGVAIIGPESPKEEAEAKLLKYRQISADFDQSTSSLTVWGSTFIKGMHFPIFLVFVNPEMYMEMELQGTKFIQVKTDSIEWSYNPTQDQVIVTPKEKNEDNGIFGNAGISANARVIAANTATINGLSATRIKIQDGANTKIIYLSKNHDLLREETSTEIQDFSGYYPLEGVSMPGVFKNVSLEQHLILNLDSAVLNRPVDESLFQIPEHLQSKIYEEQNEDKYNETGNEFFKDGAYEKAISNYNQAIQLDADRFIFFYNRGSAHLKLGNNYAAITDLTRAIELNPEYQQAWNQRGETKANLGDQASAMEDYQQAIALDSSYQDAWLNLGLAQYNQGNFEHALTSFSQLISLDSTNGLYHYNLAYTYSQLGKDTVAITYFEKALTHGHDPINSNNMIGISYYRMEDYRSAAVYFREVVARNNENPVYLLNLGKSLYEIDSLEPAKSYISKSLELAPDNDDALNHLGLTYYAQEDYSTAITFFTKAIAVNEDNAYYYDNRAFAKAGMLNYTGAIEDFTESIDLYPKDPNVYYNRAQMNLNLNNKFDACRDFRKASEMGMEAAKEAIAENCGLGSPIDPD
ncbi:tetratricopeptide repeat protein [Marinoscillum furvescens]|nr:tetratricopeptide repeat protein [Marinoscillum furvescens]